jgi:hypothetical protein
MEAYTSYERNIALKHENIKLACPDVSTHDETAEEWDPFKPPKDVYNLLWVNDEPQETEFDEDYVDPRKEQEKLTQERNGIRRRVVTTPHPLKHSTRYTYGQKIGHHDDDFEDIESEFTLDENYISEEESLHSRRPKKKRKKTKKVMVDKWTMTDIEEKIQEKKDQRLRQSRAKHDMFLANWQNDREAEAVVGQKLKPDPWYNMEDKTSDNSYIYNSTKYWKPSYRDALIGRPRPNKLRHY